MAVAKYIHTEDVHNMGSPRELVPLLMDMFAPESVVDVGCGLGTFAAAFLERGVADVMGIDGPWVDMDMRRKYLNDIRFLCSELDKELVLPSNYDLAISLEVAEHLDPQRADFFIQNLVSYSDTIIFSAAIPHQGGQNHINEQWLSFWVEKFENKGYIFYDILRHRIWDNSTIFHWYRQNMVVFSKKDLSHFAVQSPIDIVHPDFYLNKAIRLENIMNATHVPKYYFKLLMKSVVHSIRGKRKQKQLPIPNQD